MPRLQIDKTKCSRCQEALPTIEIRNEKFCDACFVFFINHKFRKPLDEYKVNYQSSDVPKLVVPVDFHRNSMCLIKLLVELLEYQRLKHNRVGFDLECIYIGDNNDFEWPFDVELKRFSKDLLSKMYLLDGKPYEPTKEFSRTSQQDLDSWITRNAIKKIAGADKVLYDYSMSYISELVLAETCKGRGALVPELIDPKDAVYPLKDILDSELAIYAQVMQVSSIEKPVAPRVSKLQSIDELIHEFLTSTRKEFPAVDSTVARTGLKLCQPTEACYLCSNSASGDELCYGCKRMLQARTGDKKLDIVNEFEL